MGLRTLCSMISITNKLRTATVQIKWPDKVWAVRKYHVSCTKKSAHIPGSIIAEPIHNISPKPQLPIGMSNIKWVIESGYYVDKTKHIQRLLETRRPTLIIRPRRFGKSLFLKTIASVCNLEKELYKDCYISQNQYEWKKYPVIQLDFSNTNLKTADTFENSLCTELREIGGKYGLTLCVDYNDVPELFKELIRKMAKLKQDYQSKIVVLIDEYDFPIVKSVSHLVKQKKISEIIKNFFTVLKACDEDFKMTFVTGVTSLSDIYSGANHLNDITIDAECNDMFGFTEKEIIKYFSKEIESISKSDEWKKSGIDCVLSSMKRYYNGYKFSKMGESVYNPWSTLFFLESGDLGNYWYNTGKSEIFMKKIIKSPIAFQFLLKNTTFSLSKKDLLSINSKGERGLLSFMFQTGYLTIKEYDEQKALYYLQAPNEEVKRSFNKDLSNLLDEKIPREKQHDIIKFLKKRDVNKFISCLQSLFSTISFRHTGLENESDANGQLYLFLLGMSTNREIEVKNEVGDTKGIVDIIVEMQETTYIIELKFETNSKQLNTAIERLKNQKEKAEIYKKEYQALARKALNQIHKKGYFVSYKHKNKILVLLGLVMNDKGEIVAYEFEFLNENGEKIPLIECDDEK